MIVVGRRVICIFIIFFFQAEDGIRDLVRSRGLGDVYKRQTSRASGGMYKSLGKLNSGSPYKRANAT